MTTADTEKAKLKKVINWLKTSRVAVSGSRGLLAGSCSFATMSSAGTISSTSADNILVNGAVAVTIAAGGAAEAWTKAVVIRNAGATITLNSGWKWQGGKVPTITADSLLILKWFGSVGIANLTATE